MIHGYEPKTACSVSLSFPLSPPQMSFCSLPWLSFRQPQNSFGWRYFSMFVWCLWGFVCVCSLQWDRERAGVERIEEATWHMETVLSSPAVKAGPCARSRLPLPTARVHPSSSSLTFAKSITFTAHIPLTHVFATGRLNYPRKLLCLTCWMGPNQFIGASVLEINTFQGSSDHPLCCSAIDTLFISWRKDVESVIELY